MDKIPTNTKHPTPYSRAVHPLMKSASGGEGNFRTKALKKSKLFRIKHKVIAKYNIV
jgi:hypothetical protein